MSNDDNSIDLARVCGVSIIAVLLALVIGQFIGYGTISDSRIQILINVGALLLAGNQVVRSAVIHLGKSMSEKKADSQSTSDSRSRDSSSDSNKP